MNVLFDNTNLNADPYAVIDLPHESVASRDVQSYELARERGAVVVTSDYRSKQITIEGYIKGSSASDLDAKMHAFKELISRPGKNLDIDYAGGTLRYRNAYATAHGIERRSTDLTRAKYRVVFLVPEGIGIATSKSSQSNNGITSATYNGSIVISGSAKPKPTVKCTIQSVTGTLDTISFQLGAFKVEMDGTTLVASDIVIFDFENKKVTLNGTEKEYTGEFGDFQIGTNSFTIITDGSTRNYDLLIEYYPSYL